LIGARESFQPIYEKVAVLLERKKLSENNAGLAKALFGQVSTESLPDAGKLGDKLIPHRLADEPAMLLGSGGGGGGDCSCRAHHL